MLVIVGIMLLPALSQSETFHLKDGSTLQGTFIRFVNDTLYVKTSFGAVVPIHKSAMLRIDFAEDLPTGLPYGSGAAPQPTPVVGMPTQSAEPGSLQVIFDKFSLTSEVIVHRGKNREELERANAIENYLLVDGVKKHSTMDTEMNQEIRVGPETKVRNKIEPEGYMVVLPAGPHHLKIGIGNTHAGDFAERFPDGVLDKTLTLDDFIIAPGHTTQVRIGLKKKFKGLGASYLYVINPQ
jgi:hypothetical protein